VVLPLSLPLLLLLLLAAQGRGAPVGRAPVAVWWVGWVDGVCVCVNGCVCIGGTLGEGREFNAPTHTSPCTHIRIHTYTYLYTRTIGVRVLVPEAQHGRGVPLDVVCVICLLV
jgi:hypothetical protein